jgi:hypothetical protein
VFPLAGEAGEVARTRQAGEVEAHPRLPEEVAAEAHLHLPEPEAGERPHRVVAAAVRPDHGACGGLAGPEDLPAAPEEEVASRRPVLHQGQGR